MGTPEFACTSLKTLIDVDDHRVVGVFTRPDAVSGRGRTLRPSPVKALAAENEIPVFTPTTFRDDDTLAALASLAPDVIVVAAYGVLLPDEVLDMPPFGCINVHASILPRWRGAAPIERAILADDPETGVSVMKLARELDAGDYATVRTIPIDDMNATELTASLAELGAEALVDVLQEIADGTVRWTAQDISKVTYAEKIEKAEMLLDPRMSAHVNLLRIRAATDKAPARVGICGRPLAIISAREIDARSDGQDNLDRLPGNAQAIFEQKRLLLGCADGSVLEVLAVKPDGKQTMTARAFAAGINRALADPATARWGWA